MTKYVNPSAKERSEEPHPVWRGIGLVMIILIPILSFAISSQLMLYFAQEGIAVSEQLLAPATEIPLVGEIYNWPALLVFTLVISLILFGVVVVINAVIYGASSNQTLRTFESQPKRFKKKRKLIKPDYD